MIACLRACLPHSHTICWLLYTKNHTIFYTASNQSLDYHSHKRTSSLFLVLDNQKRLHWASNHSFSQTSSLYKSSIWSIYWLNQLAISAIFTIFTIFSIFTILATFILFSLFCYFYLFLIYYIMSFIWDFDQTF